MPERRAPARIRAAAKERRLTRKSYARTCCPQVVLAEGTADQARPAGVDYFLAVAELRRDDGLATLPSVEAHQAEGLDADRGPDEHVEHCVGRAELIAVKLPGRHDEVADAAFGAAEPSHTQRDCLTETG